MTTPLLSILICSLQERQNSLARLLLSLCRQCGELRAFEDEMVGTCELKTYSFDKVEIIVAIDNRQITTGAKRNILYQKAIGAILASADDDDRLASFYVEEMIKGAESGCDAVVFSGIMTTDGKDEKKWHISRLHKYCKIVDETGKEAYLRYPNHLAGIRREIAQKYLFPNQVFGEDHFFATRIHEAGEIKNEYRIEKQPMYFYDFRTCK